MLNQTAALSPSSFLRKEPALRSGLPASSRHPRIVCVEGMKLNTSIALLDE